MHLCMITFLSNQYGLITVYSCKKNTCPFSHRIWTKPLSSSRSSLPMLHHLTQHLWGVPRTTGEVGLTKHATDLTICIPKTTRVSPRSFGLADAFSCEEKKWQFCSSNVCSSIFSLNLAKKCAHTPTQNTFHVQKTKSQAVKPLKPQPFSCEPPKKKTSSARFFFPPWMVVWDPPPALFKGIQQTAGWIIMALVHRRWYDWSSIPTHSMQ